MTVNSWPQCISNIHARIAGLDATAPPTCGLIILEDKICGGGKTKYKSYRILPPSSIVGLSRFRGWLWFQSCNPGDPLPLISHGKERSEP